MSADTKHGSGDFRRIEDIIEHFEKAKGFTYELLQENERLRLKVIHLEKNKPGLNSTDSSAVDQIKNENVELRKKIQTLESRFKETEKENKDFADKYIQIQTTNDNLMNLYVSSYQLHCTLDPDDVVKVIVEIIINLIGAEYFQIYMIDKHKRKLSIVASEGPEGSVRNKVVDTIDPVIESVLKNGKPYFKEKNQETSLYLACTPLKVKDEIVGAISINKLLPQKKGTLSHVDYELLSLLSDHAATALLSLQLYSKTERKLKTIEGLMDLLKITK